MKAGRSVDIFDLYEWLPGHGENEIKIYKEGTELFVAVAYDAMSGVCERKLLFTSVCSFYVQAFPGPSLFKADEGEATSILRGVLVEYPESEAAVAWENHFGSPRVARHYSVAFLAENILLTVIAGAVRIGK
ncbi:hypothetical protein [Ralstonia pseudosolanacearum]